MILDLAMALLAQNSAIALVSIYSKARFAMLVSGIAALCTLIRLSPSEVEYKRAV